MISATTCIYQGNEISIDEALTIREHHSGVPRGTFTCIECGEDVRAHSVGDNNHPAHFEHLERNPVCSYSASDSAVNRQNDYHDNEPHNSRNIITKALAHLVQLEIIYGDAVPSHELSKGFMFNGELINFRSSANGIFKPRQMDKHVLSIITTIPKEGGSNIYKDYEGDDGAYYYSFEKQGKSDYRNNYLIESYESETPFIYFKAIADKVYQCIWPCYVDEIDYEKRMFKIIVGERPQIIGSEQYAKYAKPKSIQAKYYVRETKVRGHQAEFREEVLKAYSRKCAITGLPDSRLLQAAHIIPDAEYSGVQTVRNGLALNYLHHKAYDSFLLGIDGNYKVHISNQLLELKDGPLLEHGILGFNGKQINLPRRKELRPDQNLLNRKFEKFELKNI